MTWTLLFLGFVFGLVAGYLIMAKRPRKKYLAMAEYWVYQPGETMPAQDKLLDRMVGKNPYRQPGIDPIGPMEGLVLSDIRLHMALVLRRKNTAIFRPDLFAEIEVTPEHLAELATSKSLVKIRYVSEEPLKDKRHLQFLIHAADAVADLGGATLIYDATGQRLFLKEELEQALRENPDGTRVDLQAWSLWREGVTSFGETRGLRKIGLDDLRTGSMEEDEKVLVTYLLEMAIERLWSHTAMPDEVSVEAYGDSFRILFDRAKEGFAPTRILREQAR